MREYGFYLTRILPYKDRIVDSVLNGRKRVGENPYSRIFYAVSLYTIYLEYRELHKTKT